MGKPLKFVRKPEQALFNKDFLLLQQNARFRIGQRQHSQFIDYFHEGPADAESRALVENLIGEIQVTPYADERALELELGVGALALPNVLKAGRANAYIVVAG